MHLLLHRVRDRYLLGPLTRTTQTCCLHSRELHMVAQRPTLLQASSSVCWSVFLIFAASCQHKSTGKTWVEIQMNDVLDVLAGCVLLAADYSQVEVSRIAGPVLDAVLCQFPLLTCNPGTHPQSFGIITELSTVC
jgi:hypothetical protein